MEFQMPAEAVRKNDTIYWNGEWRLVVESHNYLGDPSRDAEWVLRLGNTADNWDFSEYPQYGWQPFDDMGDPNVPEDAVEWPYDQSEVVEFEHGDEELIVFSERKQLIDSEWGLIPVPFWVVVYERFQGYGGPEEGGWFFDQGELQFKIPVATKVQAQEMCEKLQELNDDPEYRYWQVNYHGGEYYATWDEDEPADYYPARKPVYW